MSEAVSEDLRLGTSLSLSIFLSRLLNKSVMEAQKCDPWNKMMGHSQSILSLSELVRKRWSRSGRPFDSKIGCGRAGAQRVKGS